MMYFIGSWSFISQLTLGYILSKKIRCRVFWYGQILLEMEFFTQFLKKINGFGLWKYFNV